MQLSYAQNNGKARGVTRIQPSNEKEISNLLRRILGNIRHINDLYTFKLIDEEKRIANLEQKIFDAEIKERMVKYKIN